MSSCFVLLDNYHTYYYPGSTVTGKVICTFRNSKRIKEIRVKLTGEEHNRWTEEETYFDTERNSQKRQVHMSGHNTFLQVEHVLKAEGDIHPGRFEYPFFFQLPTNIPSTFQGIYGGVIFFVKAIVHRPFWRDYTDMKIVNVFSPINFNTIRGQLHLKPTSYSDDKTICCWCCASGPITMEVHLEKEAFVPRETAHVKVDITNLSRESVDRVDVKLEMDIESKVTSPKNITKHNSELLASNFDTGVGAHGERSYNFELEIQQSAAVPNFRDCKLFHQVTKLKVTAVIPGCHTNLEVVIPITMGHIPISDQSQPNHEPYQPPPLPSSPLNQPLAPYVPFITPSFLQPSNHGGPMGYGMP